MERQARTLENLDSRATRGIRALLIRQVVLQICSLIGSVILARVLAPRQFGLFATVNVTVTLIGFIGNFGLAPSFIQRRDELTDHDLQVGFTLQQALTTAVVAFLIAAAPWLAHLFAKTYPDLTWLIRAVAFSLYLTAWRSISALQLERQLRYSRLAWIEVVELISYQAVALILAFAGFGVWSLIWAVLARGLLGTALVYAAAPWKIRLAYDRRLARDILAYGIPFQVQLIINYGGVMFPALAVAFLNGPRAVGYLSWAQNYGSKPLDVVQNVMRVGFAHFSRIQDERARIERTLTRYLTFMLLMSGIWLACIAAAGPDLISWIFTARWSPAVPTLMLYALALNFSVLSSVGAVSLNSLGLVNYATRVMGLRTAVNVALSVVLAMRFGYNGAAIAWVAAALLEGQLVYAGLGRGAWRRVLGPVAWIAVPLLIGVLAGTIVARLALPLRPRAVLALAATCVAYAGAAWLLCPPWLKEVIMRRMTTFLFGRRQGMLPTAEAERA